MVAGDAGCDVIGASGATRPRKCAISTFFLDPLLRRLRLPEGSPPGWTVSRMLSFSGMGVGPYPLHLPERNLLCLGS
jgi:hypothetical protein